MKKLFVVVMALCVLALASRVSAEVREGGVVVEIMKKAPATHECAVAGDTLTVHYTGRLKNAEGKVFDTSRKPGANPFSFALGQGQVIPAWEVGMEGMCVDEVRTITAPSSMAYGDSGITGVIPPKATLFFEVELLSLAHGAAHPRSTTSFEYMILVPLALVIGVVCFAGFRLLSGEDKGKIKSKKK
jgi:hypothetical protein